MHTSILNLLQLKSFGFITSPFLASISLALFGFISQCFTGLVGLVFFFRIYVDLAVFQPYLDLEAGDNQSLKIQVARPGIEPRSSCSASQELNHSATAAPLQLGIEFYLFVSHGGMKRQRVHM